MGNFSYRLSSGQEEQTFGPKVMHFPVCIQINTKFANFVGHFPHFTTFRNQNLQFY
jgi:hypothetical protein